MEAVSSMVCSKVTSFSYSFSPNSNAITSRHFNKQSEPKMLSLRNSPTLTNLKISRASLRCPSSVDLHKNRDPVHFQTASFSLSVENCKRIQPVCQFKHSCSNSFTANDSGSQNSFLKSLKSFSFESLKSNLLQLTPSDICKGCLVLSVAIAASKWTVGLLFNPFFWMYFSWTWLFWPWMVAVGLAVYGLYSLSKHLKGESNLFEQLAIITSAFTWLTLVPPAHFNGFLEGWPFVFFFVYHYFFFLNVSVRKRLYGDYYPREHDKMWDIDLPDWQKLLFSTGVMVSHWLAAFEGTELHLIPGGWNNVGVWFLIVSTIFMQYNSTLYLAKYSEKVVVPTAVVQFGPYRFVRHPIYASTMLLFVTYFTALRAPMSSLLVIAVCLMYYGRKANLEEGLMLEAFKESYSEYMSKVRYKLIPFVY